MNIKELQVKQGNVEVEGKIVEKGDVREWSKFGKAGKVCSAVIKDESGTIKLSLWNEQTDSVNVGDKIKVSNGYVNEYQGEKQLTTGRMGKIEVVEKSQEKPEVFTNVPPSNDQPETPESSEKPVDDEEYIG